MKPTVNTVEFHVVDSNVPPFQLSWREDRTGGIGDYVTFVDPDTHLSVTVGMLGPNRVSIDISEVDPRDGV